MKSLLYRLFIANWRRKLLALGAAVVIWLLVNNSITVTRTLPGVPIRVINIPEDKTIDGLQPNGLLSKRIPVTVTGRRNQLERANSTDFEIVIDACNKGDRWTTEISKRNLVSLNPDIDLGYTISGVAPSDVTIQLSPLVTAKIPVTITHPIGEPPQGYQYLDAWPQKLYQTVSGPGPQIDDLKAKGLKLTFDLSRITQEELDTLYAKRRAYPEEEVRYFVPSSWKRITIPFLGDKTVPLNDPDATFLHLDFLKQELLALPYALPLQLFYPAETRSQYNPETAPLVDNALIDRVDAIPLLKMKLYTQDVSRFFLETVSGSIAITVVVDPCEGSSALAWSTQFINPTELEERFVSLAMANPPSSGGQDLNPEGRESALRSRFRNYMREFTIVTEDGAPLELDCELTEDGVTINRVDTVIAALLQKCL